VAAQSQDSKTTFTLDGLMERSWPTFGAVRWRLSTTRTMASIPPRIAMAVRAGELPVPQVTASVVQLLGKYSDKTFDATALSPSNQLKTTELNVNYIIRSFSARSASITEPGRRPAAAPSLRIRRETATAAVTFTGTSL